MAALPELESRAPVAEPLGEVRGPAVVAFLRHVGCPFSEATMQALSEKADRRSDIIWIAVSHAGLEATDRWCAAVGVVNMFCTPCFESCTSCSSGSKPPLRAYTNCTAP